MNKVGLITFYKDNFGSILQCYATKYVLTEMGYECDVLFEVIPPKNYIKLKFTGLARLIHGYLFDVEYVVKRKLAKKTPEPLSGLTRDMMDEFVDYEFSPKGFSFDELCDLSDKYDFFIVGSDQVWNAFNDIPKSQFLKFADDSKKIAFAASLGTDLPSRRFLKILKEGLEGFNDISVREESSVEIIERVTNVPVVRVADPTIMLNAEEWRLFGEDIKIERDYILAHFLNQPNDIAVRKIEKLRTERGIKVYCIGYKYEVFNKYASWNYLDCNPREYVTYINLARFVCTDSFHTTLFSINLCKDFFVFDRQYLHSHPQTGRIENLLKRYNLEDRLVRNNDEKIVSSVQSVSNDLENERKFTRNYLFSKVKK